MFWLSFLIYQYYYPSYPVSRKLLSIHELWVVCNSNKFDQVAICDVFYHNFFFTTETICAIYTIYIGISKVYTIGSVN